MPSAQELLVNSHDQANGFGFSNGHGSLNGNGRANGNGHANVNGHARTNSYNNYLRSSYPRPVDDEETKEKNLTRLRDETKALLDAKYLARFHGDPLLGDKVRHMVGLLDDIRRVVTWENADDLRKVVWTLITTRKLDLHSGAPLIASMSNDSKSRATFMENQVKAKYDRMLHPPQSYLGDAFKYRTVDGKFNSALHPHLGQAGAPYAKTVPSKTHPLGALPDPSDLFDRLMARDGTDQGYLNKTRESSSGLSSMLIYHATIIIHDIFRTNAKDKNISDTSSYLDLTPLYGFTEEMQRSVRDDKYKLGLLKPDCFAEDRLLRQPPGACIMLIMYNRYHNYAATQLRLINENNKFSVPRRFRRPKLAAALEFFTYHKNGSVPSSENPFKNESEEDDFQNMLEKYEKVWKEWKAIDGEKLTMLTDEEKEKLNKELENDPEKLKKILEEDEEKKKTLEQNPGKKDKLEEYKAEKEVIQRLLDSKVEGGELTRFYSEWEAAWDKLDDDLFNTARLITCGIYIQISIHDYLRALMGFHQYDTNFTLDPRTDMKHKNVTHGLGNQVTVEFNLLYRFHCAISARDEEYTEDVIKSKLADYIKHEKPDFNVKEVTLQEYGRMVGYDSQPVAPKDMVFGVEGTSRYFERNQITNLFDDEQMIKELTTSMDTSIGNFGPKNTPKCLKPVEIMGIVQARKWQIGTLNDFREFFGMKRHRTFESISKHPDVQQALRDLYEHPDNVELYPGVFCESSETLSADPGPSDLDSALWAAIFSDTITLVRSDRFYTVDWNTHTLTTWGMNEVTPDNNVLKSSVFHRLLQRAFPEWYPADSIRFFHPFYTGAKNTELAREQGYVDQFRIQQPESRRWGKPEVTEKDYRESNPTKPTKPVVLNESWKIKEILLDDSDDLVHPSRLELGSIPKEVEAVLKPEFKMRHDQEVVIDGKRSTDLMSYFTDILKDLIQRESIKLNTRKKANKVSQVYQIDAVKELAIPFVTKYVADFLGFGHLISSTRSLWGGYSENEIYQHITNCQTFLSYNTDETKLLKRREAFNKSITFLFELALKGNIQEAKKWRLRRALEGGVGSIFSIIFQAEKNPMKALGIEAADAVLKCEPDSRKATAILLFIALDNASNAVLTFTSVLEYFLKELYDLSAKIQKFPESTKKLDPKNECQWLQLQDLALKDKDEEIQKIVLEVQRKCVRLPFIRKAHRAHSYNWTNPNPQGEEEFDGVLNIEKGATVICDIHAAARKDDQRNETDTNIKPEDTKAPLTCFPGFTQKFGRFHTEQVSALGLTAMIKVLVQMEDLRRGQDSQGKSKKISISTQYETYSNYMAPMRRLEIKAIRDKLEAELPEREKEVHKRAKELREKEKKIRKSSSERSKKKVEEDQLKKDKRKLEKEKHQLEKDKHDIGYRFEDVMRPSSDTYLVPGWDEMVPFPTTWKLRFDGYGPSTYGGQKLPDLVVPQEIDYAPPWYQPVGPSHDGGSFSTETCKTKSPESQQPTSGCAMPGGTVASTSATK